MININSATQPAYNLTVRNSIDNSTSTFSDLFAAQLAKNTETDNSKHPAVAADPLSGTENTAPTNTRDELNRLLAMNPFELIRYQMLSQMGLTEDTLQELPFEERMKIEETIKEKIEQQLGTKADSENTVATML